MAAKAAVFAERSDRTDLSAALFIIKHTVILDSSVADKLFSAPVRRWNRQMSLPSHPVVAEQMADVCVRFR